MKLTELEATFVGNYNTATGGFSEQNEISGAQGVMFDCPQCKSHSVLVWFANPVNAPLVSPDAEPKPARWTASGSGIGDLTLTPSIDLNTESARKAIADGHKACLWHGFVKTGDAA